MLTRRPATAPFEVHLDVFSGPFELLLGLIAKHKLDVTEISLARVTDEFVAHIRAQQQADRDWDLSQASEFLLVAATLLELKAARLLPARESADEDDLALIEARDLLFARLLQYRAFKEVADWCAERMDGPGRIVPRRAALEARFATLMPELVLGVPPERLAAIASQALTPRPDPVVGVSHLHEPLVSLREQTWVVSARLRAKRVSSFRGLTTDAESTMVVVARFLVLLTLFQTGQITFDQADPLGELMIRWTGGVDGDDGGTPGDQAAAPR